MRVLLPTSVCVRVRGEILRRERGRRGRSCSESSCITAAFSGVCVPVCGVAMVLIGTAIKSVLKYLNRTRGESVCVVDWFYWVHKNRDAAL